VVREHDSKQDQDENASNVNQNLGARNKVRTKQDVETGNACKCSEKGECRINDATGESNDSRGRNGYESKKIKDKFHRNTEKKDHPSLASSSR
jgi:hypothetical protein